MKRFLETGLALVLTSAASAWATPRTFVKSTGSDVNPCTFTSPCRNFAAAIAAVDAGGEVIVLDSAGYGAFTVNKAVTITAPKGVYAGISATSGDAITVSPGAGNPVVLRGLTLTGLGATYGIHQVGGMLHVDGCFIGGFSVGIVTASGEELYVDNSAVHDCAECLSASGNPIKVSVTGSRFERSTDCGVVIEDGADASVSNSAATGNLIGFCSTSFGGTAQLNLRGVKAADNGWGVRCSGAAATVRVAESLVTENGIAGFSQANSCTFESLGDSLVRGNTANIDGAITPVSGI